MYKQDHPSTANLSAAPRLASETWKESPRTPSVPSVAMGRNVKLFLAAFAFLLTATTSQAQWEIEDSHTTASLRGITNVGGGVAWASGTGGTVLRTTDDGKTWQTCPVPGISTKDTAEKLDFRGIQAFDAHTAIVMSSGPGDQSRLYKTTDGCQTWKLLFTNPDPQGFWDCLKMADPIGGLVIGDPAKGPALYPYADPTFRMRVTADSGETWVPVTDPRVNPAAGTGLWPLKGESFFAASNSSALIAFGRVFLGTSGARVLSKPLRTPASSDFRSAGCAGAVDPLSGSCGIPMSDWTSVQTSITHKTSSSGIFSLASGGNRSMVAVGGDYSKPSQTGETTAYSSDAGLHWLPAKSMPNGYRSAVAYDSATKTWITVGPNGTDISTDDGRNWRALTPTALDGKDADKNWNALSLPFVVGPKGRIGKLRLNALSPAATTTGSKAASPK